jgi:hypothetical protein
MSEEIKEGGGIQARFILGESGPTDINAPYVASTWDLRLLYVHNERKAYLERLKAGEEFEDRESYMEMWKSAAIDAFPQEGYYKYHPSTGVSEFIDEDRIGRIEE